MTDSDEYYDFPPTRGHMDRLRYELLEDLVNGYVDKAHDQIAKYSGLDISQRRMIEHIMSNLTWSAKEEAVRFSLEED